MIFAGTRRGLEGRIVPKAGFRLEMIRVRAASRRRCDSKDEGCVFALAGFLGRGKASLKRIRPAVVMGVGGYVAGPLLAVAGLSGVPTLIVEPNATPGLTNRWLVATGGRGGAGMGRDTSYFGEKGFVSGNPVREEITRVRPRPVTRKSPRPCFRGKSRITDAEPGDGGGFAPA